MERWGWMKEGKKNWKVMDRKGRYWEENRGTGNGGRDGVEKLRRDIPEEKELKRDVGLLNGDV
jgi:hypothetical protein